MANMLDYLYEYGHDSFQERGFSPIDSLILSMLAYARFEGISVEGKKLWELGGLAGAVFAENKPSHIALLRAAALSRRFSDTVLRGHRALFDHAAQEQFSAISFLLSDGTAYAAFRGTDDTLVGWKEDFNMAFMETPGQGESIQYIDGLLGGFPGRIRVGGHSKGGNLAVYGAMYCKDPSRILQIFSHDGPGFRPEICNSAAYSHICHKIHKTVPESSVVGLLLQQLETYNVVESSRTGIMQHDGFSWQVNQWDFAYLSEISEGSRRLDQAIKGWFDRSDEQKVKQTIDNVYQVLDSFSPSHVKNFGVQWKNKFLSLMANDDDIDPETKRSLGQALSALSARLKNNR